jgi:hypothetical protein
VVRSPSPGVTNDALQSVGGGPPKINEQSSVFSVSRQGHKMLQDLLWLFDDPFSDLLLAGVFILAALHHRQMRLMQQRTNQLTFQVSELKMLIMTMPGGAPYVPHEPSMTQRGPSMRFDETTLSTASDAKTHQRVSVAR